ncbi:class I SAM-dependent methyltransferase [Micromonospora sp. NPDC023956]|uniref:SAM-dependent methyltransferase n=1 Tax=Micromonospora sp. NPDC023956 TaxID=3155722 RepID=UPI0033D8C61A
MTDDLDAARYARMRWNAPLSEEHAALLLDRLAVPDGARLLDLGCGWGELLLRAVSGTSSTTGVGVDTNEADLARGRTLAVERSLDSRVTFAQQEASAWREPADRVLCIGASHAFGGTAAALDALTELVPAGGRLLFGDGFWERPPSAEATGIFGDQTMPLADLVEQARTRGWRVLHLSTADQREWDDFESTWRAGRQEWLLAHADDPRAAGVRDELDTQLRQYVSGYRGVLGFAYLVLGR